MYLLKHQWSKLAKASWRNRQELIAAGMHRRRDLLKLGLLTAGGMLIAKHGLSSRVANAGEMESPFTPAFVDPLPIPLVKRPVAGGIGALTPYPTIEPNNAGGEGRTRAHQAFQRYPNLFPSLPDKVFEVRQREALVRVSRYLPLQKMWGFDGMVPGPTYYARYGEGILVRNRNDLPANNGGFGIPQVTTHLHNSHTPSESDGFPTDYFPNPHNPAIANAAFYDQHYPNVYAGFASSHWAVGDVNEALSTLWYHDHRVGFTSQNVYKGLAGFYILWNEYDGGDETNPLGFRFPGVRSSSDFYAPVKYDVPLMLTDRLFDEDNGQLYFDLFEKDGILGDKFLVNGKIQPYFIVEPRRYRFRILDAGPSRFYQLFLTDKGANTTIPFWLIANDGNLLPRPLKVNDIVLSVAERNDIVVDFSKWAGKTLYLENRLVQNDGRGPDANAGTPGSLKPAGAGDFILQFRVKPGTAVDHSLDLETLPADYHCYTMPRREIPRVARNFRFKRTNSMWSINDRLFPDDGEYTAFRVKQDSAEQWGFQNNSGGWMHPIHVHMEEHHVLRRNGVPVGPGNPEYGRKDTNRLQHGELNTVFMRFRDWEGRYPIHCHNTLHEDSFMMMRFDIDQVGDKIKEP
ncbi:MAG TPA: multicopper oxidase domain-containing protein [Ramlibacter sp.]|nr:multicopper oxidase domain-containing protein [Ramlibacter sp.]